jgi:predicted nucleic acid-binding protein
VSVELHSAVARKRREGHLSEPDARRIVAQFRLHLDDGCYSVLPLEVVHFDLARDWLGQFSVPLRTLDALHLAVCSRAEAELLTADRELFTAARSFGMRARLLA